MPASIVVWGNGGCRDVGSVCRVPIERLLVERFSGSQFQMELGARNAGVVPWSHKRRCDGWSLAGA